MRKAHEVGDDHEDSGTAELARNLHRRDRTPHLVPVRGQPPGRQQRGVVVWMQAADVAVANAFEIAGMTARSGSGRGWPIAVLRSGLRKRSQPLLALARQSHQDASAVGVVDGSSEQSELDHAVDQFHRGMVPDQHEIRQIADGNRSCAGKALDGEKGLMLLRRQPGLLGRRFTERKKPPELKPKLGERFVVDDWRGGIAGRLAAWAGWRLARLTPFRSQHSIPRTNVRPSYSIGGCSRPTLPLTDLKMAVPALSRADRYLPAALSAFRRMV